MHMSALTQKDHKHVQFTITKINDNIKHGQYNSSVNEYQFSVIVFVYAWLARVKYTNKEIKRNTSIQLPFYEKVN